MIETINLPRSVVERALAALEKADRINGYRNNRVEVNSLIAALKQPDVRIRTSVPVGWKLVPEEPADSQIRAAQDTWWHACNCETYWDQIYAAMIAAAPQPPVREQPQGEQEPVGEAGSMPGTDGFTMACFRASDVPVGTKLYTRPQPKREPLTDEQINDHRLALPYDGEDLPDPWDFKQGVRAAERAHRIGGEA